MHIISSRFISTGSIWVQLKRKLPEDTTFIFLYFFWSFFFYHSDCSSSIQMERYSYCEWNSFWYLKWNDVLARVKLVVLKRNWKCLKNWGSTQYKDMERAWIYFNTRRRVLFCVVIFFYIFLLHGSLSRSLLFACYSATYCSVFDTLVR